MRSFTSVATINAPREVAWRILSDVVAWPDWLPTVSHIEMLDGAALRLGARFFVHQPALRPAMWRVVELRDPESFTWEAGAPGLHMVGEHRVERRSATQSAVQLKFTFYGFFGAVAGWVYGGITRRYLAQEAAALKAAAEVAYSATTKQFSHADWTYMHSD